MLKKTRSYAALRAADLDWIVGPGYSLGRVHSGEKPYLSNYSFTKFIMFYPIITGGAGQE